MILLIMIIINNTNRLSSTGPSSSKVLSHSACTEQKCNRAPTVRTCDRNEALRELVSCSKVLSTGPSYNEYARALTFQNVYRSRRDKRWMIYLFILFLFFIKNTRALTFQNVYRCCRDKRWMIDLFSIQFFFLFFHSSSRMIYLFYFIIKNKRALTFQNVYRSRRGRRWTSATRCQISPNSVP
jgi:hypothetical protein